VTRTRKLLTAAAIATTTACGAGSSSQARIAPAAPMARPTATLVRALVEATPPEVVAVPLLGSDGRPLPGNVRKGACSATRTTTASRDRRP